MKAARALLFSSIAAFALMLVLSDPSEGASIALFPFLWAVMGVFGNAWE